MDSYQHIKRASLDASKIKKFL
ncbi:hypothetical protein PSPO01_15635 [Paraphaeosphaeria sporulosa]